MGHVYSDGSRVTIVQQAVLQYRVRFFELLRTELAKHGIELSLIHSNPRHDTVWRDAIDLPWAVYVPMHAIRLGSRSLLWQRAHRHVRSSQLVIVEHASKHLLNYVLAAEQLLRTRRLALWGHGKNFQSDRTNALAEWISTRLARVPHWWFAYTELSADLVTATGFPRERITVVQNALDAHELADAVDALDDEAAFRLRQQLGVSERHVGIFIGGLGPSKKLDYLLAAADAVHATTRDFALLIVGAGIGPEAARVQEFERTRSWVHVLGPRFGAEKAALLRIADVLLMPAWAGLVVVDAFAAGVPPVISATQPHPPEASYVRHGVNGLVVEDGGSPERFGRAVADLLEDASVHEALVRGCHTDRYRYTVEKMVGRFTAGVCKALVC